MPPYGKTAISTPKSNDKKLKKFDFSLFILKFEKIKKKCFLLVILVDQEGVVGTKLSPVWLRMHLRGYGF